MKRAQDSVLAPVPVVRNAVRNTGRPLGTEVRQAFESQVSLPESTATPPAHDVESAALKSARADGKAAARRRPDFSQVRVHTGAEAARSADALGARAFTVGSDIVFGRGQFEPGRESGSDLLAHELAHTVQPGSDRRIAKQVVEGMETAPVESERADIEKMLTGSYWEQKITAEYGLTFVNTVQSRFQSDTEERDAVLAAAWKNRPAKLTASTDVTVSIPPRASAKKSKALLYTFTYAPAPQVKPAPKTAPLPTLAVELKAEDSAAVVSAAPVPPSGYTPPVLSKGAMNFPGGVDDYFKKHPDEHKQLYHFIENAPGPKASQIVTTTETQNNVKHDSAIRVTLERDVKGKLTSLELELLSETPIPVENPPADYASRTRIDIELEKNQAKAKDKLGAVNIPASVPADEQASVKYMVWQYFDSGTRNKEVDIIIPIANKQTRVFYTLRFRPTTNDVDVERVGEEGATPKTKQTGMAIERVEGFTSNSTDEATFKTWVGKRYPSISPQGKTLAELQDSVSKDMQANAGTPAWFKRNYSLEILNATAGETRLQKVHKLSAQETVDMKDYTSAELNQMEFGLQTMSDPQLSELKTTQMARQKVLLEIKGNMIVPDTKTGGIARHIGSDHTITMFDTAASRDKFQFAGGSGGVREASVQTYIHEFGHVFADKASLEAPFQAFVKAKKIPPLTWYAKTKVTEQFPEAFALYQTDPEFMKNNAPDLFTWFEELKKTGKPPKKP